MESGTKLGHYEISTLLGKGGMGEADKRYKQGLTTMAALTLSAYGCYVNRANP